MKKIPTIFLRDWDKNPSRVTRQQNPDTAWVFNGEGIATKKYDGQAVRILHGQLFKRLQVKNPSIRPPNFELIERDETTGERVGWVPVLSGPEDKYLNEALILTQGHTSSLPDGTYEAIGPKIQGNPEKVAHHKLVRHGATSLIIPDRSYDGIRLWFERYPDNEGIVFHHIDGRMAKIKLRDYGMKRPT
jgi:hypothetical protein